MLDQHRDRFLGLELLLAGLFERLPVGPNVYTLLSLVMALAGFAALIESQFWTAIALFILASLLDLIDGAVARAKGLASKKGAYLDTIADRYVEAIGLFGLLFIGLPDLILPGAAWVFLALLGSTMVTYAKSAAKEKGLFQAELKGGLMSRAERIIVFLSILILLALGYGAIAAYLLALLALLTNVTALQRIFGALTK